MKTFARLVFWPLPFLIAALTPLVAQLPVEIETEESNRLVELAIEYAHNPLGWPALHYAIHEGQPGVARFILQFDPEQAAQSTPLIKCVYAHLGSDASSDYDSVSGYEEGTSALELAVRNGYVDLVAELLEMGVNVNEFRMEYDGSYANAWKPRRQPTVYERCKFILDMRRWTARSPLYWAIMQEDSLMVALLLQHGALLTPCITVQQMDYSRLCPVTNVTSALLLAARQDSTAVFEQLLIRQAEGRVLNGDLSLLHQAVANSVNLPALHYAVFIEDFNLFTLLLDSGFNIHYQGNSSKSLLEMAVEAKDERFLDTLLAREDSAEVALAYAVKVGDAVAVSRLMRDRGAALELLTAALHAGDERVARVLLTEQSAMERDPRALRLAIQKGYDELVELMIVELGYWDEGALFTAIEAKNEGLFFLLFDRGAYDPEAIDLAIEHNQHAMVKALLKRDCPSSAEAARYVKRSIALGQKEVAHLLLDYCPPCNEE